MKNGNKAKLWISLSALTAFLFWTVAIVVIDVKAIGPENSSVGFGLLNGFVHDFTGVNMTLYNITDWLGLVPIFIMMVFTIVGLLQWIKRKKIKLVDFSMLVLGGFYLFVLLVFLAFEVFVVNYRPVLINGYLEASYPSSTTMLVMCVVPTAIIQIKRRVKNNKTKLFLCALLTLFAVFMVIARLVSGVHWITDIIGGALISVGLVTLYSFLIDIKTTPKS